MNDTTTYREKGRAVFLAAIMVLSVVAMSAAFAGAAAAAPDDDLDGDVDFDPENPTEGDDVDINVTVENTNETDDATDVDYNLTVDGDEVINETDVTIGNESLDYATETITDIDAGDQDWELFINEELEDDGTLEVAALDYIDNYSTDFVYQGESLLANPGPGDGEVDTDDNNYQVREVTDTSGGEVTGSSHVEDLTGNDVYEDGFGDHTEDVLEIVTSDYDEGDYFVRGGEFEHSPDVEDTFEVGAMDLDVDFDDDEVTDESENSETEIEFDSNRGTYDVNVSADGDLEYDDLEQIFVENGEWDAADVTNYSGEDDDVITIWGISDDDYDIGFDGIDTGDYDFEFESDDTDAEAEASITVAELDVDGSFSQGVYTQSAGDIEEVTLELEDTDDAFIQIGDEDAGFVDVVYVETDDDYDEVSILINTRMMGAPGAMGEEVYYVDDGDINSIVHGDLLADPEDSYEGQAVNFWEDDVDSDWEDNISFKEYVDELTGEEWDDQLTRPAQPTDYSLTADAEGNFIVDDGESEADNEIDAATLDLLEPELGEINTWVAPSDDADEDDELEDLSEVITERTDVAEDDRLIIEAEASGLYGALAVYSDNDYDVLTEGAEANALHQLVENEGEGINFEAEADDAVGNQDPTALELAASEDVDDEDVYILVNNEEGVFYVVVDTSSSDAFDGDLEDGQTFDVELEYETDAEDRYEFNSTWNDGGAAGDASEAYPYFSADSDQSVSTSFDIVEPDAEFDNLDADDNVQIEAGEDTVLTGETNIAPGSDGDLRISNAGDTPSFLSTEDISIDSDGTWESESFDFDDRDEDDEAELNFRVGGSGVTSADGIFVEAVEEVDDEDVEDDDADDEEADEEDDHEDDDADDHVDDDADDHVDDDADDHVDDDDDDAGAEGDGVPGFGIAVALFALIAAGMLALRRQN